MSFIAGDRERRWEPSGGRGGWYWPPELPADDDSLDGYLRCFESLGFRECADGALEDGIEKIAVYADDAGDFSHVARQLVDGYWSSKLGSFEDLSHEDAADLFRGRPTRYGENLRFMCRDRHEDGPDSSGLIVPSQ